MEISQIAFIFFSCETVFTQTFAYLRRSLWHHDAVEQGISLKIQTGRARRVGKEEARAEGTSKIVQKELLRLEDAEVR